MIPVLLLFLFNPVNSKFEKESSCLEQIECSTTEAPICIRVKQRNQNVMHVIAYNQCEIEYKKCYEGTDAVVVPMKHCHYANDTGYLQTKTMTKKRSKRHADMDYLPGRVITDTRQRNLGFFIDKALEKTVKNNIKDLVKLMAEEAVKFYDIKFFTRDFMTEDVDKFIDKFNKIADTDGTMFKCTDYYLGDLLKYMPKGVDGFFYVFLCGYAKDYDNYGNWNEVKAKVTFILWPQCYDRAPRLQPGFQAFFDLAVLKKGQVIRMAKGNNAMQLQKYIRHTALEFNTQILLSEILPQNAHIPVKLVMADFALVSVSGSNVEFAVRSGDWKNKIEPSFVFNGAHTKVYRYVAYYDFFLVDLDTSLYDHGKWNVSVNIMSSRVDFTFQYRFSKNRKWRNESRRDTLDEEEGSKKKPKYLIIYVTEKRKWVEVNKIKFIDLDEDQNEVVFASHALVKIAEDTYATEYKIGIPTHDFFMVASGVIRGNNLIKEVDSIEVKYRVSDHQDNESSEEDSKDSEDSSESEPPTTDSTPSSRSTCSMWPESLLEDKSKNKKLLSWTQFRDTCPGQCPVRDVLVCARCQHGVHRTFLSVCHMRMYQCKHPRDKLNLVARRPCIGISPFLGDVPRPAESLGEPQDNDVVMSHIYDKQELYTQPQK